MKLKSKYNYFRITKLYYFTNFRHQLCNKTSVFWFQLHAIYLAAGPNGGLYSVPPYLVAGFRARSRPPGKGRGPRGAWGTPGTPDSPGS